MLKVENLSVEISGKLILDNINLSIESGSKVALLGSNGSGKTTLLKSILSYIPVKSGNIEFSNISHNNPIFRKDIYFLPEKTTPPLLSKNLDYIKNHLNLVGFGFEYEEVVNQAKKLNLDEKYLILRSKDCSKGTMQKICLIIAFLSNKSLIILDEPSSGLDEISKDYLYQNIILQKNKTVIYTNHSLSNIDDNLDQIIILKDGCKIFDSSFDRFIEQGGGKNPRQSFINIIK